MTWIGSEHNAIYQHDKQVAEIIVDNGQWRVRDENEELFASCAMQNIITFLNCKFSNWRLFK